MEEMKQLSGEARQQFKEGVSLVLSKWWALQMAVQNGWGGPHSHDKALDFASRIFSFFHQANRKEPIYLDDLEDLLWEGLDTFNTEAEDGSIEDVAEQLMIMHEECLEGRYDSIQKLMQVKAVPVVKQDVDDSDEDEEDENMGNDDESNMMVDSQGSLPIPDPTQVQKNNNSPQQMAEAEDGWVTVPSRKNRGRKV